MNIKEEYHKYGKIYNLSHREVEGFLTEECVIEEKVDGSQFSFGVFDGELRVFSRRVELTNQDPPKDFRAAIQSVREAHDAHGLVDGWTYRGECVARKQHNTLVYERTPKGNVIIFEIDKGNQKLLSYEDKYAEATRIGFETVPMFFIGNVTQEVLDQCMKQKPFLGGEMMEGVVIKRVPDKVIDGRDKKVLMAKFVSDKFKERHDKEWNKDKVARREIPVVIAQQFSTPARWEKAAQRIRDEGKLETENPLRNIPLIIKEVWRDIEEEEMDTIKDQLYNHFKKDIQRQSVKGIPNWWKDKLNDNIQFAT